MALRQVVSEDTLEKPPGVLLAVDPGKTSGIAVFVNGESQRLDQVAFPKITEYLDTTIKPYLQNSSRNVIVCENFRLMKGKALQQSGSTMEASRVLGMMEMWAQQNKCEYYEQEPSIKPIAQKWSGVRPPSNHRHSHSIDAFNHGVYWLVRHGMRTI